MASQAMQLAAFLLCSTVLGCFQYLGVDALSSNFLRHRRAIEGCQELITDESVSLSSPGYPNSYTNGVDCWTLIRVGEDQKVHLTFEFIDLEDAKNCILDYVEVLDGDTENATSLSLRMCQEDRISFESTSRSLLLHFFSDESENGKGYLAHFKAVMAPQGGCVWDRGTEGGTISSPGHPGNYPSATHCSVVLVAPENSNVVFDIESLQLELEANCSFDFLTISEGTPPDVRLLGRFCGLGSEPKQVESTGREVQVQFQSDDNLEFSGFKLRYRFVRKGQGPQSFHMSVSEGLSAVLPCNTRHRNVSIRWLKGEVALEGAAPLPGLWVMSNGSLRIEFMGSHLMGVYKCVAVLSEGQTLSKVHVNMVGNRRPCNVDFRTRPSDSEFIEGEFAYLECLVNGSLRWLKDGRPLETLGRVTVLDNGYVFLPRVRMEDAGTYTCVGKDVEGCVGKADAKLKLLPKISIQEVCGQVVQNFSEFERSKTVGRSDAPKGAYPWQVMLWDPTLGAFCGATLLNERWVVTAASCLDKGHGVRWDRLRLFLGKYERELGEESEVESSLSGHRSIVVHPDFDDEDFDNDVALIRMHRPVRFSESVQPLCLAESVLTESMTRPGEVGVVIGWGRVNEDGSFPKYLQEAHLPVVEQEQCIASTIFKVTDNMFCTGYSQDVIRDACSENTGGPFMVIHGGRWHLAGVVSWGEGCGRRSKYGFYTRIANYIPWIQSVIQS